jgi:sulfite reductase alpha subunit-like flavoprotein
MASKMEAARALASRVSATILYATESGTAEKYAQAMAHVLRPYFSAQVMTVNS